MSAITVNQVRSGFYLDSVALMRVSAKISAMPGVQEAALMIGSESNKEIMLKAGLLAGKGRSASPNDLIIGIRADSVAAADQALAEATASLDRSNGGGKQGSSSHWRPRSLSAGVSDLAGANLALISVPGEFAAREARKALRLKLNVMMFSDNVSIAQEKALKIEARDQGLLVMGPDCGTAFLQGTPLAFANAIPAGRIGVIAASGTGLQEFSVLIARGGQGLSHGIGVGGRDLKDEIGGISTLTAIDLLEQDRSTEQIVLISKPPGAGTAEQVMQRLVRCRKPVIVCFLGAEGLRNAPAHLRFAPSLRAAAELALGQAVGATFKADRIASKIKLSDRRRWIRGLFSGGTLCSEAQVLLQQAKLRCVSNVPIPEVDYVGQNNSVHILLDLGADEYTLGRPHPMIEPGLRNEMLAQALTEPAVAVILLDVVLGYGGHADPTAALNDVIRGARNPHPVVVASVCGVSGDPQGYHRQVQRLENAGVIVAPSNAQATELAMQLAKNQDR